VYARAGLVGITVDGPQTGSRLKAGSSILGSIAAQCGVDGNSGEDNAMFDVCNPSAIADNIRESAIEAALVPRMMLSERFTVELAKDGSGDPCGLAGIQFDDKRLALMGHSMGATIVPLVLALEPRFRAVVMSGANASYIENFPSKQQPFELASTLEQMLGLDYCLDEFELLPSLFEWAEETSDPAVYERYSGQGKMPDVLMIQGIGDHYVPSPVANASSLGLGLDVAGKTYDDKDPHLCPGEATVPIMECRGARRYELSPVAPLLSSVLGRKQYAAIPPGGLDAKRAGSGATTFVSQYPRDMACRQDGHEVAYQIAKARWQYRCFLESFAAGHTRVFAPPAGDPYDDSWEIDAPCPKGGP
jgi:hypothetical protein